MARWQHSSARRHVHAVASRAADRWVKMRCSCLLSYDLACVEFDQHGPVCFKLFHRDRETKVIEDQELKLKMIELN